MANVADMLELPIFRRADVRMTYALLCIVLGARDGV